MFNAFSYPKNFKVQVLIRVLAILLASRTQAVGLSKKKQLFTVFRGIKTHQGCNLISDMCMITFFKHSSVLNSVSFI